MYLIAKPGDGLHISEAHTWYWKKNEEKMVNWWLFQSEREAHLRTTDNEQIIVIRAGELNDGPGPDILNCHLFLNDIELSGSVEMHQKSRDWFHHNHDSDPAYDDVILHVVGEQGKGPDIATLVVEPHNIMDNFCPARRAIERSELLLMAQSRYADKVEHIKQLFDNSAGLNPLFLGMLEVLFTGCHRSQGLTLAASILGLAAWPDKRRWMGSRQAYPSSQIPTRILDKLMENSELFDPGRWAFKRVSRWAEWDGLLMGFRSMGVSQNQTREWLVNVLAPYNADRNGFDLWLNLPRFRAYGHESRLCRDLGLSQIESIAEQQALLAWNSLFCRKKVCSSCPLSHIHQRLARID